MIAAVGNNGLVFTFTHEDGEEPEACVRLLPKEAQLGLGRRKQAQVSIHHELWNLMSVLSQQVSLIKEQKVQLRSGLNRGTTRRLQIYRSECGFLSVSTYSTVAVMGLFSD